MYPAEDPPVSPAPVRCRRKDARPGELIEAAIDVFVERGYAGARLDDIARRAGVTKGTVYLYFRDKEELFEAVVRETLGGIVSRGQQAARDFTGNASDLLRVVLGRWWREIVQSEKVSALPKILIAESGNFPPLARSYYRSVIEPGRALLRDVLERGIASGEFRAVDVEDTIHFIIGPLLMRQCAQHSFARVVPGANIGSERFVENLIDHLLHSLEPRPVGPRTGATP